MKNNIIKFSLSILLIVTSVACKDYLELYPIDVPSSSVFPQTEKEFELVINGAYQNLHSDFFYALPVEAYLDLVSDIGWHRIDVNIKALGNGQVHSSTPQVSLVWTNYYSGIQRCNLILEKAKGITEIKNQTRFDEILAEAKFLRAYYYYHLTEMFGAVPFITTPIGVTESNNIGKTEKSKIVDFLLSDLEDASGKLPLTGNGRATKGAALALKARIALFNKKWDVAIDACNRVTGYKLEPDYSMLYLKEGQAVSKEIMFMIEYKVGVRTTLGGFILGNRNGGGASANIPVQSMVDSYLSSDGLTIDKSPLYNPKKPFENRDPRLHYSLVVPGSIARGFRYETDRDSVSCWNYNVTPPVLVANNDALSPFASFSGYLWRKYEDQRNPDYRFNSETGYIILRYAEVLLTYAEAKIENNNIDQSVYDAINQVRLRVKMPIVTTGKSQSELRSILRIERKTELAGEGLRLYDIRRWRIAENVLNGNLYGRVQRGLLASAPVIDKNGTPDYSNVSNKDNLRIIEVRNFSSRNYLWPIPQIEIDVAGLKNNPGY